MQLDFAKLDGLVPAIVQDAETGEVLMLGFMNEEAYAQTRSSGAVTFFSRTRNRLWRKGEQSGHTLRVREVRVDCDNDTVLVRVDAAGPGVCHEGYRSCFFRRLEADGSAPVVAERTFDPDAVYKQEVALMKPLRLGLPKRQPAGRHIATVCSCWLAHLGQLAQLLSCHRRSRDHLHAGPRPGDGALCGNEGRTRCRDYRARS